jgi:hypothetical protein
MDEKPTSGSTRAVRRTSNGEADRYLHGPWVALHNAASARTNFVSSLHAARSEIPNP